jgi:transcriptional regulator with XRE-family HTH domain
MNRISVKYDRLKELRKKRGLQQEVVALRADTCQAQLSKIENGAQQPGATLLFRILGVISVSMSDFMANVESLLEFDCFRPVRKERFTHVANFDQAIKYAQFYSNEGNWELTHTYLSLAEVYAVTEVDHARVRMGYGVAFRDRGYYEFAQRYFHEAARLLGPDGDQLTQDKLRVLVAESYIYQGLPTLASPLINDVCSRLSPETLESAQAAVVKGRTEILFGNLAKALDLLTSAHGYFVQHDKWRWAGWSEVWIADAESQMPNQDDRNSGIGRFEDLIERFGTSSAPLDIDIFAWASLKRAIAIRDSQALEEARSFAELHDKVNILKIIFDNPI